MPRSVMRLLPHLLWLAGVVGLAVALGLILSGTQGQQTAQAPEPTAVPLTTAQPAGMLPPAPFDSPIETPTLEATEPPSTPEPTLAATLPPTPIPNATPVPAEEAILYTVRYEIGDGQVEGLVYSLAINPSGEPEAEPLNVPVPVDFYPLLESVSPDGQFILFSRSTEAGGKPYVLDLESGEILPLYDEVNWGGGRFFDWYPDSSQILFWDLNDNQLRLIDVQTGDYTVLSTVQGSVQGATISPKGQEVIYIDSPNLTSRILYRISSPGGEPEALVDLVPPMQLYDWSPDGRYVLYYGSPELSKGDIAAGNFPQCGLTLLRVSDQNIRFLNCPSDTLSIFKPVWSPDSRYVACTAVGEDEPFPCQEEDGQEVDWYTCYFQGTFIYVEDIQSGEVHQLAPGIMPVWSPDGSRLAFLSDQGGAPEVWLVNADGSNLHQITNDGLTKEYRLFWTVLRSEP
jgi:Tol biopolymer transport system component